jgi:hypothetical protein
MHRHPLDLFRLFLSLFQDLPPLSRTLYVPGAILLLGYPVLTVLFGAGSEGQAFVTAFMAALAVRIALGFEGMVRRMLTRYSAGQVALMAFGFAALPLLVLSFAADPVWCQRMQSAFYLVIGLVFLSDVVKNRVATAASFWPDAEMRQHLPNLTRAMVIYNFAFLLLNETLIQTMAASNWLLFWAVLPILGHTVLRALVLTVVNLEDDGHPV